MSERDKYLNDAMGIYPKYLMSDYKTKLDQNADPISDFSTWPGFGKLKSFMEKHELRVVFWDNYLDNIAERVDVVAEAFARMTPDSLADFAYEFLKERNP